jgi:hypothetical protein
MAEDGTLGGGDVEPWISTLVAAGILASAVALTLWHLRVRRSHHRADMPAAQYEFYRQQFRRRIQVSTMLGLLGLMLAVETWVERPQIQVLVGVSMLFMLLWIMLLAVIDALATRMHYARVRNDFIVERAKLEAEARRLGGVGGNGKPRDECNGRKDKDRGTTES